MSGWSDFWKGLGTGIADVFTLGGYSANKNREAQEKYNQQIMQREDDAYQRAVADAEAAGLHPSTVAGTGGAGAGGSASTPQTNMQAIQSLGGLASISKTISEIGSSWSLLKSQKAGIDASTALTEVQKKGAEIANAMNQYNLDYYKDSGLPTTADPMSALAMGITFQAAKSLGFLPEDAVMSDMSTWDLFGDEDDAGKQPWKISSSQASGKGQTAQEFLRRASSGGDNPDSNFIVRSYQQLRHQLDFYGDMIGARIRASRVNYDKSVDSARDKYWRKKGY